MSGKKLEITIQGQEKRRIGPSGRLEVQLKPGTSSRKKPVDIVFVIDTTGSMSDKIEGLLTSCARFVDEAASRGLNAYMGVVSFGDLRVKGDRIVTETQITGDLSRVKKALANINRNFGGANEGESSLEALNQALQLAFRPSSVRSFILITDEAAHQENLTAKQVTSRLRSAGVLTFCISNLEYLDGLTSVRCPYFKTMAEETGGEWFQIESGTNFLGILAVLADRVSRVVEDVYRLTDGDVQDYLRLKAPGKN